MDITYSIDPLSFIAAIISLGVAYKAYIISVNATRLSQLQFLQEQIVNRAIDINRIFSENVARLPIVNATDPNYLIRTSCVQIITSIQLLDNSINSLNVIEISSKRDYLLLQYWIQLDTSLREFIKSNTNGDAPVLVDVITLDHLMIIRDSFSRYYENY